MRLKFSNLPAAKVFAHRDYRLLWGVLIASSLVVWLRILGTSQWLLDETGSAAAVGIIGVVQLVVQIPALLWGGSLADRANRRTLMGLAHGGTSVTLLGLAWLNHQDLLTSTLIYTGIAISAVTAMLSSPARSALVPLVVRQEQIQEAVSVDTASSNTAAIIGPLLFAGLTLNYGLTSVFLLAGTLAAIAALQPLFMQVAGKVTQQSEERESTLQQIRAGFSYVAKHPILPGLFLLDAGITATTFYREILPVLALGLFAGGASATGLLSAANSGGAILGALLALYFAGYRAKGMLVLYASFAYGFILLGFAAATSLWVGLALIAALGAADAVTVAVRQTTVMLTTPDAMRGRAFSLMILAAQTANNLGTIWVGAWAAAIGAANTMYLGAALSIAATALIWWLWKPIRNYNAPHGHG